MYMKTIFKMYSIGLPPVFPNSFHPCISIERLALLVLKHTQIKYAAAVDVGQLRSLTRQSQNVMTEQKLIVQSGQVDIKILICD